MLQEKVMSNDNNKSRDVIREVVTNIINNTAGQDVMIFVQTHIYFAS